MQAAASQVMLFLYHRFIVIVCGEGFCTAFLELVIRKKLVSNGEDSFIFFFFMFMVPFSPTPETFATSSNRRVAEDSVTS